MSEVHEAPSSNRLADQSSRAARKSKNPTANESLIISLLKEATSQLPMQQNMSIISAALRVPFEVSKFDMELLKAIRNLSHSFIIAREFRQDQWISWAYPFKLYSGDYQKFVEPWASGIPINWVKDEMQMDAYPKVPKNRELTEEEHLFLFARWLSKYTFDLLEISFAGWSAAHCQRFAAKVADYLSPASNALLARVLAGMSNNTTNGAQK